MGCARLPFVGLWGVTPMGWAEGVRLEDGPREDLVFRKIVIYLFFLGWAKIVAIYLFCMDVAIFVIV